LLLQPRPNFLQLIDQRIDRLAFLIGQTRRHFLFFLQWQN